MRIIRQSEKWWHSLVLKSIVTAATSPVMMRIKDRHFTIVMVI